MLSLWRQLLHCNLVWSLSLITSRPRPSYNHCDDAVFCVARYLHLPGAPQVTPLPQTGYGQKCAISTNMDRQIIDIVSDIFLDLEPERCLDTKYHF